MSWVYNYCDRCPLKTDMLADVRGRPCVFTGCPKAPKPWEWAHHEPSPGQWTTQCPGCGMSLFLDRHVLDQLVSCPIVSPFYHCKTILRVKGTGSWIKKLVARFRLTKQQRADRAASNLWP